MKKVFLLLMFPLTVTMSCSSLGNLPGGYPTITGVSQSEASTAIRQALEQGVGTGISLLNKQDGFFGNAIYKVLLPPEAVKIENTLRQLGMSSLVDKAILQINRAAEDAVGSARPIFVNAITSMTIADALNIIKGPKNSATSYFENKTTSQLIAAFLPIVKQSLDKVSATKFYGDIVNTYNSFPTTLQKLNPDLPNYVVGKAVAALFDQIAKEELNIRENFAARSTDILKKVFTWAAQQPQS